MSRAATTTKLRVPPTFFADHADRCPIEGRVIKSSKTYIEVELTDADISDLFSDAIHYSDRSIARDMGMPGLASSARSTISSLERQLGDRLVEIRLEQQAADRAEREAIEQSPEYLERQREERAKQEERRRFEWDHPSYGSRSLIGWNVTDGERVVRVLGVSYTFSFYDGWVFRWTIGRDEFLEIKLDRVDRDGRVEPRVGVHGSWKRVNS